MKRHKGIQPSAHTCYLSVSISYPKQHKLDELSHNWDAEFLSDRSDVALRGQSEASGALTHQYCPGIEAPQACGEVEEMPRPTAPEAG
ncbi:hypothetical protein PBY51_007632 [Eleginops maclovinus]|uniref:Uncharacterized protein n=1 Tax=Eleginops maclovinus TaxID=56733 RepID=A0AAN7X874_ELEMC|nr:hypothetical protein PBY51_007632 [Eleginops maclovinus]